MRSIYIYNDCFVHQLFHASAVFDDDLVWWRPYLMTTLFDDELVWWRPCLMLALFDDDTIVLFIVRPTRPPCLIISRVVCAWSVSCVLLVFMKTLLFCPSAIPHVRRIWWWRRCCVDLPSVIPHARTEITACLWPSRYLSWGGGPRSSPSSSSVGGSCTWWPGRILPRRQK